MDLIVKEINQASSSSVLENVEISKTWILQSSLAEQKPASRLSCDTEGCRIS